MAEQQPTLEDLSFEECRRLLAGTSLGRVGVTIGALPAVLPVNFVVDDDGIVFRTVPGTKLDAATARAVVAFEADGFEAERDAVWSVLVRGMATEIVDPDELARARALPLQSWALGDRADRYVRVGMELVSGRRAVGIGHPSAAPLAR
jgi:nitroimidazol reductase NimA-like FMN-containing flavoprotein (pyridoxamine 5'-phosphate oxidase superfamily)